MMNRWRKGLAALLAALMLVSLAPMAALAEERAEVPPGAVMAEESRPAVSETAEESEPTAARARTVGADSAEDQAQAMSLLPLEEVELSLDLNDAGIFWSELDAVPVALLLNLTNSSGEKIQAEEGDVILWAKADGYVYDDNLPDAFTQVGLDGTMDLTPPEDSGSYVTLHLIVGKPDQLRTTNTRYIVKFKLPQEDLENMIEMTGYYLPKEGTEDTARTLIDALYSGYYDAWRTDKNGKRTLIHFLYMDTRKSDGKTDHDIAVKLSTNAPYDVLTPLAYYGSFSTQEALDAAIATAKNSNATQLQPGADITDQLFAKDSIDTEGGYTLYAKDGWASEVTLALKRGDRVVAVLPFRLKCYITGDYVELNSHVYDPETPTKSLGWESESEVVDMVGGEFYRQVYRMDFLPANAECLIRARYTHEDTYNADYTLYVEKVVASSDKFYSTIKSAESLPDIKDDFFGDGYKADYSKGVYFTVFSKEEGNPQIETLAVRTEGPMTGRSTGSVFSEEGAVAEFWGSSNKVSTFGMTDPEKQANGKYRYRAQVSFGGEYLSGDVTLKLADYVEKAVAGTRYYDSLADAKSQTDIKDKLLYISSADEAEGYEADFSKGVCFTIFWKTGSASKFTIKTVPYVAPGVSAPSGILMAGTDTVDNYYYSSGEMTRFYSMNSAKDPANGRYSYRNMVRSAAGSGDKLTDYVEKAVASTSTFYDSLDTAKSQTDIKDKLLYISSPDEVGGYEADFSKGVYFTIFWKDGYASRFIVKTVPYVEPEAPTPEPPTPEASRDTYFYVNGAKVISNEETQSKTSLDAWAMPGTVDGYYFGYAEDSANYGVQTVFLLNRDGTALEEGATIYPTFVTGDGVTAYAGHRVGEEVQTGGETQTGDEAQTGEEPQTGDEAQVGGEAQAGREAQAGGETQTGDETEIGKQTSGEKQVSGESPVTFRSGEAIQYSASAENTSLAKNYWVTFATRQSGAKLYANGHIDELKDKEEPNNPVRSVQLDGAHNFYHDIFFANIGDEPLEGLSVELNATNVELDPYWTIGETKTLAPFTTVEERTESGDNAAYGMLPNVGKIRLLPKRNADGSMISGDIEGTITIKSTNGGELTFDLTGKAQGAKIVTETLVKGVRYVPYNSMIQTDVMGASDAVTFSSSGNMPKGVTLFPNGKLYGVPTDAAGAYTFTVTATYAAPGDAGFVTTDSKKFTLTVLPNTAENVDAATDEGYELLDRVDDTVTGSGEQTFRSHGDLSQFMYFYLDGARLEKGKDYTVTEGSTRIVIQGQTLKSKGSGTHTLAAEFRTNSSDTNTVKRAAQNYTVPSSGSSGGSGSSGSRGGFMGGSGRVNSSGSTTPTSSVAFRDVKAGAWYYDDVMAVAKGGLMIGIGDELFAPDALISQPMVVTILSRMAKAELPKADDVTGTGVEAGQWYTPAAVWAWRSGIVGEGTFAAVPPLSRGDFATTLARYLNYASVTDPAWKTADATFADEDQMTEEQLEAFRKLYAVGILKGVGDNCMAPQRATSRAELATVVQRLSAYLENK